MEYRVVATGVGFCEGPVWTRDGRLVFTSIDHGCLYELAAEGARVLAQTGAGPNGLTEGRGGVLYVTQNGGIFGMGERSPNPAEPGILRVDGGRVAYLARGLDAPNDLCFGPDGRLYFTDPRGPAILENDKPGRVYALLEGQAPELLAEGPAYANGIAFGPDGFLYVNEMISGDILRYRFESTASIGPRETFANVMSGDWKRGFRGPDGMAFGEDGNLYCTVFGEGNIAVIDPSGRVIRRIRTEGQNPTNLAWGPEGDTRLFVTEHQLGQIEIHQTETTALPLYYGGPERLRV